MREPLRGAPKQLIRVVGEGLALEYDPEMTVGLTHDNEMTRDRNRVTERHGGIYVWSRQLLVAGSHPWQRPELATEPQLITRRANRSKSSG